FQVFSFVLLFESMHPTLGEVGHNVMTIYMSASMILSLNFYLKAQTHRRHPRVGADGAFVRAMFRLGLWLRLGGSLVWRVGFVRRRGGVVRRSVPRSGFRVGHGHQVDQF